MPRYTVEISRTISTSVEVDADTPEQAMETVSEAAYPLPPRDQWEGHKDWCLRAYNDRGEELADQER